jgi:CheY-like chemotaxis protein/anti-sigma regulatory factor (Ser/Thr protein kinase)
MEQILIVEDDRAIRHLVTEVLKSAGFAIESAADGVEALQKVDQRKFDLMLLDIWMPKMNGLDVLAQLRGKPGAPRIIVMTADNTPETMLRALREQAYRCISKPFQPKTLVDTVRNALAAGPTAPPIEVVSALPDWIELLVPCDFDAADRIQAFLAQLKTDLSDEVREALGRAFRELLLNAVEWGGKLDPTRKVRIACLRMKRMILYRIQDPGPGFKVEELPHAAVSYPSDQPFEHVRVREEKGMRSGGFGLMLTQALVDELIYNESRNEVVFVKYLD